MTILYSNGCSFTDNRWIPQEQRYPFLIGKQMHPDVDGMQAIADYFIELLDEQE